jgi:hypothetical protein
MVRAWIIVELINRQSIKYVRDTLVDSSGGSLQTISINNGGTGYTASDIGKVITVASGSAGRASITGVSSSGVITSLRLVDTGSGYTAGTAQATTGGTGSGLTVNTTIGVGSGQISTLVQSSAGSGYTTGDVVQLMPNFGGTGARATVTASAGAITALAILSAGSCYSVGQIYPLLSVSGSGTGGSARITAVSTGNGIPRGYYAYDGTVHTFDTETGSAGQIKNDFTTLITNYNSANKYLAFPDAYTSVPANVLPSLNTYQPTGRGLYNYNYIANAYVARIFVSQEWYDASGTGIQADPYGSYPLPIDGPSGQFSPMNDPFGSFN